jgi:hypothetical protein
MRMKWPLCVGVALHLLALLCILTSLAKTGRVGGDLRLFVGVFFVLGELALVDGLAEYAQWKGYDTRWALVGFLSLIGLVVALRLPYRESEYSRNRPVRFDLILLGMDD